MSWRLAKSLITLRDQINAAHPGRSKASDGTIGDAAHASRASDHNPWLEDKNGIGVVTAADITHDPLHGVDGDQLAASLIKDSRTKYVIFAGRIWKARTGQWEVYRGPNSHHHHCHLSVKPDNYDNDSPWALSAGSPPLRPTLKLGDRGEAVTELQTKLRKYTVIEIDGQFGPRTEKAVKYMQRSEGLPDTGIVDEAVWKILK